MAAPKPELVVVSEYLLWSTVIIAIMIATIDYEHMQAALNALSSRTHKHYELIYFLIPTLLLQALLIAIIFAGKRWGRTLFLASFAYGLFKIFPAIQEEFHRSAILGGLSVVQIAVQIVALFLLFTQPAQSWFEESRRT